MPGFNINGVGDGPVNTTETRRVHRWIFAALGRGSTGSFTRAELLLLKSAQRPKFKFEDVKLEHNQETAYFAGKQSWESMELTWYDAEQSPDVSAGIYAWLETVVQIATANVSHPSKYKQQAVLQMLSGMDMVNEEWKVYGTWPQDVDWKGLDYTSSEIQTCVAKMRYDRAVRSCLNNATVLPAAPSCPISQAG